MPSKTSPLASTDATALHAILKEWDEANSGRCTLHDLWRAVQALRALGMLTAAPTKEALRQYFGHDGEALEYNLLIKPNQPAEEDSDPADQFREIISRCAFCGKASTAEQPLSTCTRCKTVRYCSRPCQLKAWRAGHKESCGAALPTPSRIARGGSASVARALREFGPGSVAVAIAALKRLCDEALAAEGELESLRQMHEVGGTEAVVSAMEAHADEALEVRLRGYMLLTACCQTSREGALAAVRASAAAPIVSTFEHFMREGSPHQLRAGVEALGRMADTGITGKEAVVDARGPYWTVLMMREHPAELPLQLEAIRTLGSIAYRGGIKCRKAVVWNSAVNGVVAAMRAHVTANGAAAQLAEAGVTALRYFIAGDETGVICGSAAELAHNMTRSMTEYLGVEAVVDAMMWHPDNERLQENGAAVLANICSVDLGAKRQAQVLAHSSKADTQVGIHCTPLGQPPLWRSCCSRAPQLAPRRQPAISSTRSRRSSGPSGASRTPRRQCMHCM